MCQTRERFFLLAVPKESRMPSWPPTTHFILDNRSHEEATKLMLNGLTPTPTVDEAFRGILKKKVFNWFTTFLIITVFLLFKIVGLTEDTPNMHYLRTNPSHLKRLTPNQIPSTVLCTINPGWYNIHPNTWRYISVRECARLQTFPDDYVFYGDLHSQYRQGSFSKSFLLV